ncbi:MAG: MFS transporter, partial [Calditrichia bacterium]
MMSILSVYLTEHLHFAKESVGLIKGTIQPLLYFLPIISGALADRFGYRRTLMVAFSFLGLGYFLTAQATSYALVFGALVVMGVGAGTFKPIISGTIARVTDEKNSTLGFGIFYWSINLGAFLFPLILVPVLKKMDWSYVIIASAIGTAAMLIPTFLFYKEPVTQDEKSKSGQTGLIQTLANAFEIIYSPVVLLYHAMRNNVIKKGIILGATGILFLLALNGYLSTPQATEKYPDIGIRRGNSMLVFTVDRNMLARQDFRFARLDSNRYSLVIHKPRSLPDYQAALLDTLQQIPDLAGITASDIDDFIRLSDKKVELSFEKGEVDQGNFNIRQEGDNQFKVILNADVDFRSYKEDLRIQLGQIPVLAGVGLSEIEGLYAASNGRSFFLLYVSALILIGLAIISYSYRGKSPEKAKQKNSYGPAVTVVLLFGLIIWFLPGLTMLGRIISYIIFITITSLFIIDKSSPAKFRDHAKFLLMIFLYSGFWILYFQMFDSVLWYVQAYVNAGSLNQAVNNFLGIFGVHINWFFDVEHVTVINAGTIILLQLVISNMVKNTRALPTMISGIAIATAGMGILAVSTSIWIFLMGIILFSIGEMTAHPKFISYIGLTAPPDKKAMYMGYLFLYGVFGSSIGGILGAKLYVHFVDNLNQPKVLWLIFSGIGIVTIVSLLLYNRFLAPDRPAKQL